MQNSNDSIATFCVHGKGPDCEQCYAVEEREMAAAHDDTEGDLTLIEKIGAIEAVLREKFNSSYVRRHAHEMAVTALWVLERESEAKARFTCTCAGYPVRHEPGADRCVVT